MSSLSDIVARHTANVDGSHDHSHLQRVAANCSRLCAAEGLSPDDARLCAAAAWAHDLDDKKYGGSDALPSARSVLAEAGGYSAADIERVCAIIRGVSFSAEKAARGAGGAPPPPPDSLTAVVQDADRLDAIGAHGIARCFCFGGARNRPLAESVAHFHEKLLTLKGLMKTAAGRREADARHDFMVAFLAQMDSEAAGV